LIKASTRDNPFLPPDFYEAIRGDYGQMFAQQELEGDFIEIAGLMFRREWFQLVNQAPADCVRVRYWDQAATSGAGCYTAGLLLAVDEHGTYYVENVVRGQWGPLERNRIIDQVTDADARRHRGSVISYVEQEGGSGGKEIAAQMVSRLAGHAVFRDVVSGKRTRVSAGEKLPGEAKVIRAMGVAAASENGNIRLVRGDFNENFIAELCAFPEYKYCDQVDAFSGAFNRIHAYKVVDSNHNYQAPMLPHSNPQSFGALATLQHTRERRGWESLPWNRDTSDDETAF
jgi:predicted phage terminase large subunit-like protein